MSKANIIHVSSYHWKGLAMIMSIIDVNINALPSILNSEDMAGVTWLSFCDRWTADK